MRLESYIGSIECSCDVHKDLGSPTTMASLCCVVFQDSYELVLEISMMSLLQTSSADGDAHCSVCRGLVRGLISM